MGAGDVRRGRCVPLYMLLPRLFTCPTISAPNYKIGKCSQSARIINSIKEHCLWYCYFFCGWSTKISYSVLLVCHPCNINQSRAPLCTSWSARATFYCYSPRYFIMRYWEYQFRFTSITFIDAFKIAVSRLFWMTWWRFLKGINHISEFELNIAVIFEDDYLVTENFPILLVRSK